MLDHNAQRVKWRINSFWFGNLHEGKYPNKKRKNIARRLREKVSGLLSRPTP